MAKSFVFLLYSLFTLSFPAVSALAARHERGAAPPVAKLAKQRRQVSDGSSPSTADSAAASSAATTDTQMFTALGNAAPTTSSMPTVTTTVTTTVATTTYTTTTTTTVTIMMTSTTSSTSTPSRPPSTNTSTCPPTVTASSCADLSTEPDGNPYTAPMCNQYNLECNSYYYTDDSNTLATYYNVETFRDCADLCDETDGCNLFFLGTAAAGDQDQECFLLSSDEYGMATNTSIADSGIKVGYVSQADSDG